MYASAPKSTVGTVAYIAPEVLTCKRDHTKYKVQPLPRAPLTARTSLATASHHDSGRTLRQHPCFVWRCTLLLSPEKAGFHVPTAPKHAAEPRVAGICLHVARA